MNYLEVAIEAAMSSGKLLQKKFYESVRSQGKGAHDLVSNADFESEKIIVDIINKSFPQHHIQAEEIGSLGSESDFNWYVDPLDGTSNFLTGNPYFSISIAIAEKGEVIAGVVYNPILNELYTAERGKGAFINGKKLRVGETSNISSAIIASAYASDEEAIKIGLNTVEKLSLAARKVIINFSPALDLCNIARGKIDALVDNGTTPEDHAAGSLIATESGALIRNYSSEIFEVNKVGIIAGGPAIAENLKRIL